ncbi:MAG: ferrous iron transport protein B [bacterium]
MTKLRIALAGAPNCGKSTLFNGLTGGRAKVANYPGATVELRVGQITFPNHQQAELIDLPGFYGLAPRTMDERIAVDVLKGDSKKSESPDLVLMLIDATNLRTHLQSALQIRNLGLPMILVLNMFDLAKRDGLSLDIKKLEEKLGIPVITCQATRQAGRQKLLQILQDVATNKRNLPQKVGAPSSLKEIQQEARQLTDAVILSEPILNKTTRMADRVLMHPLSGPLIFAAILFFMFQAVYSWAAGPITLIEHGFESLSIYISSTLPDGWVKELLINGVIAGVGSVLVFLPQIIILFAFILLLEASGYMARAAFMMDELMTRVGLNGRAFIPLLSSFACAIPGIMATRVIESERDRLTTILIAPLMTCSARIPVYTLLIGAFIPPEQIGLFNLQGIVMFGLYMAGVVSAIGIAYILKRTIAKGPPQALMMELPTYKFPNIRDILIGLWTRVSAFLRRAGTIILGSSIILWLLASYPASASLKDSYAGKIGSLLEIILAPIGFNLEMSIALIPGMAAREVAIGALGTVYAVQGAEDHPEGLASVLQHAWDLPMALAFLAWYIFAPQCFATLATMRRETNSWKWTGFAFAYLMALAYITAGLTFHISSALIN